MLGHAVIPNRDPWPITRWNVKQGMAVDGKVNVFQDRRTNQNEANGNHDAPSQANDPWG